MYPYQVEGLTEAFRLNAQDLATFTFNHALNTAIQKGDSSKAVSTIEEIGKQTSWTGEQKTQAMTQGTFLLKWKFRDALQAVVHPKLGVNLNDLERAGILKAMLNNGLDVFAYDRMKYKTTTLPSCRAPHIKTLHVPKETLLHSLAREYPLSDPDQVGFPDFEPLQIIISDLVEKHGPHNAGPTILNCVVARRDETKKSTTILSEFDRLYIEHFLKFLESHGLQRLWDPQTITEHKKFEI